MFDTAAILAALLLPIIALDDASEIGEAIRDIYTHEIGGAQVASLADALACVLDGDDCSDDERFALECAGLLVYEEGLPCLPRQKDALRLSVVG